AGRLRGRSFNIDRSIATLGRAEENAVGLFGDPGVQARHAVIERRGNGYVLKNLAVQQGVFLNGDRIETAALSDGDRIKIGDYELSFHLKRAAGAPRPAIVREHAHPAAEPVAAPSQPGAAEPGGDNSAAPHLIGSDGRRYAVRVVGPTTLGRAVDNDIVISDASVSRHPPTLTPHDRR